jgi:RNA polymerase sigma factor (sigma-70 family)
MEKRATISPGMNSSQDRHITDIIASHSKRLMGFIRRRVTSEEDAEDILQDVFYQLTESLLSTRPIEQLTSWLFTVARNKITDRHRKKRETSLTPSAGEEEEEIGIDLDELLSDGDDTPETVYLRSLFWKALEEALDELPPAQRDVFVMHELEGLSFNEIAEITGDRVATLISRKRYAVIHLRERLHVIRTELLHP